MLTRHSQRCPKDPGEQEGRHRRDGEALQGKGAVLDDECGEQKRVYCGAGDRKVCGVPRQHSIAVYRDRERTERHHGGQP